MRLMFLCGLLLACIAAAPAHAQGDRTQQLETLMREMTDYAEQADRAYAQAVQLTGQYGYARQACEAANRAAQFGIRSRNRIFRARKLMADFPETFAQLDAHYTNYTRTLNHYKRLFNEHCGNEPYPIN